MQTITCLINDNYDDTPNPLIYVVEVNDPSDADEVLAAVTKERFHDLGVDYAEVELDLLVAFKGDVAIAADWRG